MADVYGPGPQITPQTVGEKLQAILGTWDPNSISSQTDAQTFRLVEQASSLQQGITPTDLNFAAAFDPSHSMYSVKTDNASVNVLEDLNNIFSVPPVRPAIKDPAANTYIWIAGVLLLYILMKGKF
jgi:hypothetical protein